MTGARTVTFAALVAVCGSGAAWGEPLVSAPATAGDEPSPARERSTGDAARSVLRLHVLDDERRYVRLAVDVYSAESRASVYSGTTADVGAGEAAAEIELSPGTYKIVRRGAGFNTLVDFAAVTLEPDRTVDYLIVVREGSNEFRGAGVLTSPLPQGLRVGGVRVSLSGAGTLMFNTSRNVPRQNNGVSGQLGLFANAAVDWQRGPHRIDGASNLQLSVIDPRYGKPFPSFDLFRGHVVYGFRPKRSMFGVYARAGFWTAVAPGYLYLNSDDSSDVEVSVTRRDGSVDTIIAGGQASLDDLRVKLAGPFAPAVLQQEFGADLKAFQADLRVARIEVETRVGYGLRQGFTGGLLVVDGDEDGPAVQLSEVDDYTTHGPILGAAANATFSRWLYGQADFDLMVPVTNRARAGADFRERLIVGLAGTASFRLPSVAERFFASFDYTVRIQRDGFIIDGLQVDQSLMFRANVSVL